MSYGCFGIQGSVHETSGRSCDRLLLGTRAIRAVVMRGTVYQRPTLDGLMADTRAKVAQWNAEAAQ